MKDKFKFECQKCGKCCKWLFFPVSNTIMGSSAARKINFYLARGIKLEWSDQAETLYACIPHTCRHLNTDNTCNIYSTRPEACRQVAGIRFRWLKCPGKIVPNEQDDS